MQKMIRPRGPYRPVMALAVLLAISACAPSPPKAGSPEALLNAEGDWKLVEEERAPGPEQKHMNSRAQVNPKKSSTAYTENVKLAHVDDDVHFRVLRLERQMNTLRGDFDKILPPLAEEARAGKALESAIADIQTAAGEEVDVSSQVLAEAASDSAPAAESAPPPPMAITPEKKPQAAPVKTAAKAAEKPAEKASAPAGAVQVTGLRTGEHPGRTRLVLDISAASKFSADMDTKENLLVVDLPSVAWAAPQSKTFGSSPLLKGYSVQSSATGTHLVIETRGPAKLASKTALPPNDTYGHRIVLDVSPL